MPPEVAEPMVAPAPAMEAAFAKLNDLQGSDVPPPAPDAPPAKLVEPPVATKPPESPAPPVNEPEKVDLEDDLPRAKKKEAAPAPVADPKKVEDDDEKRSPKELRAIYRTTKAERDTLKGEIEKLRAEQTKLREDNKKAAAAEVQQEIEELRKQVADYDVKVRYLRYSESGEFKEKYQEPLKKAWQAAANDINGFRYTDANGVEQEASVNDIAELMKMNATSAAVAAKRAFGDAATEVLAHRRKLIELTEASENALQDYRKKGSERAAEESRNSQNAQKQAREFYENHLGLLRKERAEFFGFDPADEDGNNFIRSGEKLVNRALLGEGIPEGLTPQEKAEMRIKAQAEVAARASAFGRERHRVLKLQEENESLKKKIAAFEKSEPDAGEPKSKATAPKKDAWEAANDSLMQLQGY